MENFLLIDENKQLENIRKYIFTEEIYGYKNIDYIESLTDNIMAEYLENPDTLQKLLMTKKVNGELKPLYAKDITETVFNTLNDTIKRKYPVYKALDLNSLTDFNPDNYLKSIQKLKDLSDNNKVYQKDPIIEILANLAEKHLSIFMTNELNDDNGGGEVRDFNHKDRLYIFLPLNKYEGRKGKAFIKESIRHELIHILDDIRRKDDKVDSYSKKLSNAIKNNDAETTELYVSNKKEFNQCINNFLRRAMKQKGTINSFNELVENIFYDVDWEDLFKGNEINQGLKKMILKRLSREGYPDNPRYTLKYNPTLNEEVIEEGIRFFKTSKSLNKLYERLVDKAHFLPDGEDQQYIINLSGKVKKLANKFEEVENEYASGNKQLAISKYNDMKNKYEDILKILNKERTKKILKILNSTVFTLAIMTIPYIMMKKFFPNLYMGSSQKPEPNKQPMVGNQVLASDFQKERNPMTDLLKRSGALIACGIPVRTANNLVGKSIDNLQSENDLIYKLSDALSKSQIV